MSIDDIYEKYCTCCENEVECHENCNYCEKVLEELENDD